MYHFQNPSDELVTVYLQTTQTIAVIGLSQRKETASHRVSKAMQEKGYRIIPVNPRLAGQTLLGEQVYASLKEIPHHVDMVNVYRRSEDLPVVAEDFVAIANEATIFWAQLGLESELAEQVLAQAGCKRVVMNRCIKREYARLLETESLE